MVRICSRRSVFFFPRDSRITRRCLRILSGVYCRVLPPRPTVAKPSSSSTATAGAWTRSTFEGLGAATGAAAGFCGAASFSSLSIKPSLAARYLSIRLAYSLLFFLIRCLTALKPLELLWFIFLAEVFCLAIVSVTKSSRSATVLT